MITIKKGKKEMKIPTTAFKNFYEGAGWSIVEDDSPVLFVDSKTETTLEEEEDWDNIDDGVEKPLSEMNRAELNEKANELGIDISDCVNNKQIREKIKANIK